MEKKLLPYKILSVDADNMMEGTVKVKVGDTVHKLYVDMSDSVVEEVVCRECGELIGPAEPDARKLWCEFCNKATDVVNPMECIIEFV